MRAGTAYDVWILSGCLSDTVRIQPESVRLLGGGCKPTKRIEGAASPQEAVRRAVGDTWDGDPIWAVTQSVALFTTRLWVLSPDMERPWGVVKEILG